jgi:phage terminase large subunit-like protein
MLHPGGLSMIAEVTRDEIFSLAAKDNDFFCRTFFPNTFRQPIPDFHRDIWTLLSDQAHRRVAVMVFRGGGKTTLLRTFLAKRIAYGITRVAMFVSETQDHARRSLRWLRKQIEFNPAFTSTYCLSPGKPWTDEICEINHELLGQTSVVMALGITGQIRGFNIDDYRPDLIIVDDPCNEENTATPEQRLKTSELFFGGLEHSLAPQTESPDAKIVLLQTPFHPEDLVSTCHKNPGWASRRYSCFNPDGSSVWPERFPTETLLNEKSIYMQLNQLSLWFREMECQLTNKEESVFRQEWLKYYDILPSDMVTFMGIDPVPPPTDSSVAKNLHRRDFECLAVVGRWKGNYFLLEYSANRGHTPEWTSSEFFRLLDKWHPRKVRVETTAYQSTLKWYLEQEMRSRGRYVQIDADDTKRKKLHLISQALSGIASSGSFYIRKEHRDFIEQFSTYPYSTHDDILNAVALAVNAAQGIHLDDSGDGIPWYKDIEPIGDDWRVAP